MTCNLIDRIRAGKLGETLKDEGEKASVPGLSIRIYPTKKTFMLYYRTKRGVQRRPKIGDFGPMTLAQARKTARSILDRVAQGEDPQGEWAQSRAEMTVEELFNYVWGIHWKRARYANSGWANEVAMNWRNHIKPVFGSKRITEVTRSDVRSWHAGYEDIPTAGNRSLENLKTIYHHAERDGLITREQNPCWYVAKFPEKKRNRYATPDELRKIIGILEREQDIRPAECAFLYLVMFTGSRCLAVERATWDQLKRTTVDGEEFGILTFQGKSSHDSGEDETVIVPPFTMKIIDSLPKREDNRIVGIRTPNSFWERVRAEAGCPDLWARDLRRTFATIGMSGGVNKDVIGRLLNHASAQTTDIYAKLNMHARIEACSKISGLITDLSKVIPLRKSE